MGLLDGKVAIITGSGGGLGRCHALAFAKEGALVVVNDPGVQRDGSGGDQKMADQVVEEIKDLGGKALSNFDSVATLEGAQAIVKTALDTFGCIDILVNNAGILRDKTLLKMDEEMWDLVLSVHLKGSYLMTKVVGEVLKDQGSGGRIINTSSYAGLKGNFGQANYGAAKAGIYGLTLVSSLEFRKFGITVNCIAPMAKTRMTEEIATIPDDMKAEQISPMVLYLASDLAKDISGRVFGVHGNHYFEYKMEMTEGVRKESGLWTPEEIGAKLEAISASGKKEGPSEEASSQLKEIFENLPKGFDAEAGTGWKANIHFKIKGAGNWTLKVHDGVCETKPGLEGDSTCIVESDSKTITGIFTGTIKGEQAFMEGKIKATNIADMMRFGQVFQKKKADKTDGKSSPAGKGLNRDFLNRFFRGKAALVSRADSLAYAEATGDPNPLYREEKFPLVPPLSAVRYCRDILFGILEEPELNANMVMLVHGEQEMKFFRPIRVGDLLCPRATITSIEEKSSGETISIQMDLYADGEVISQARALMFIRGEKMASEGEKKEPKTPWKPSKETPDFTFDISVDKDQPIRYGHASLDINPIHMDENFARQAGLPGNILQGLCTMAFASQGVVQKAAQGDVTRLKGLKVRFAKPVLPGDKLQVQGFFKEEKEGLKIYEVALQNQDGVYVLIDGLAEVQN